MNKLPDPKVRKKRLAELEALIHEKSTLTIESGWAMGEALQEIIEGGLYREKGFSSVEQYARTEFGFSRSTIYRLIDATKVRQGIRAAAKKGDLPDWLSPRGDIEFNGKRMRPLARIARQHGPEAAVEVAKMASHDRGDVGPTAERVEQAAREFEEKPEVQQRIADRVLHNEEQREKLQRVVKEECERRAKARGYSTSSDDRWIYERVTDVEQRQLEAMALKGHTTVWRVAVRIVREHLRELRAQGAPKRAKKKVKKAS